MTKELQDDVRRLGLKLNDLADNVMNGNANLEQKIKDVDEYTKSMQESALYEAKRANDRIDAVHQSVVSLTKSIKLDAKPASEYAAMLEPTTIGQTFVADQQMQQELFKIDEEIRAVLEEKTSYMKRLKELEVEIKRKDH